MTLPAASARQNAASAGPHRIAPAYTPPAQAPARLDSVAVPAPDSRDAAPRDGSVSTRPGTLPALLAALAREHGEREALVSSRGRLKYGELAALAERVARALAARGVGHGTHVGLLLPNWPEWLAIAFGVWRCGAVLVPLNTLYRPRELGHALAHAEVSVLVGTRAFLRHDYAACLAELGIGWTAARAQGAGFPALRHVALLDPAEPLDLRPLLAAPAADPGPGPAPDDPATILFTSGSTAAPKGVVHTHAALRLAAEGDAAVLGITPDDRTWGYLPFFFAGGLVAVALATLSRGGAVVLQDVFEAGETLRLLEAERASVFFAWPHQAEALVAHPRFRDTRLRLTKGVGANTKWAAALYPPDHHAVGSYGMTETPPLCTAWPWDAPIARRTSSHGPAVGGRELRIVDPATGAPLAAGVEGEICVRGPELLSRYHGEPAAACRDAEGFFHTGDLGRLDEDGALHFVGRSKDVIKTAGANVAAAEVEAVLLEHPAVAAAHAVGVSHPARGEEVAAFVVLKAVTSDEALLAHCRALLASYKVPRHLWVRAEGTLPTKGSGKVDKAALRAEATRLTAADGPAGGRPGAPR
jgi:fatty-acyl-CoA synthase